MKTKGKAWHLVVTVLLILAFVYTAFFGVSAKYGDVTTTYIKGAKDIRFGVDIKGGVNVTFVPSEDYDATEEQLEAAQLVIENRLVALNVTDYELYVDPSSDSLILEFPWQSGETDFDPESAIQEIGTTAYLTFREGSSADGDLILDGSMIESAAAQYGPVTSGGASEYYVSLKFTDEGAKAFGEATTRLAASNGTISIWLDDENVSTATVNAAITDGEAIITSSASNPFTQDAVVKMARQINSGALPFALKVDSYSTVSPSLGENSLSAMVLAGVIAFALIVVFMTVLYRLPGFLACIALAGQVAATLAFVSGYFPVFESFTLTLPGIAGIILAIGMVMVIIATHIDLSVGSLVAFIGGVCALLMERAGVNWMLAIVIALVVGLIVGVWQGFWVAVIGIPGFITTLAGMLIFRGLATVIVGESVPITSLEFRGIARNYLPNILGWWGPFDGLTIVLGILCIVGFAWSQLRKRARVAKVGLVPEPMSLTVLKIVLAAVVIAFVTYLLASSGNADQGGTPIMLVIVGVLVFIYNFILTKTVFGRHVYAVGGNRKAAILSGINTRRVDFLLFVHMGFLSAVAAVCMLSRLASATAQAGMEFEMDAIAACFIGGTAVTGGIGTIPGAVIGAFVMGVINQGLSIMGVDTAVVKTIKGLVLLLAVAVDIMSKRKKS